MTNGSATYCSTAQEDNATLEVMTRLAKHGLVDYDRIMIMRTISDFSRPPPSMSAYEYFFNRSDGGISASLENLLLLVLQLFMISFKIGIKFIKVVKNILLKLCW